MAGLHSSNARHPGAGGEGGWKIKTRRPRGATPREHVLAASNFGEIFFVPDQEFMIRL
jgi:hypothetical protein